MAMHGMVQVNTCSGHSASRSSDDLTLRERRRRRRKSFVGVMYGCGVRGSNFTQVLNICIGVGRIRDRLV